MVVLYFYHPSVEKPNLPLAVRLLRNCSETFFCVFRVWVANSTAASNVSSAFIVNFSLFRRKLTVVPLTPSKYYSNFLNEFPSLSIYKVKF